MSQSRQIALADLESWVQKETASTVEPLRNKAASLLKEVQARINDTVDSSEKIFENSQREMQKNNPKTHRFARNANKFAERLAEMLKGVKVPEQVRHDSLQTLSSNFEKTVATTLQLRAEAYAYITPYFIFDRRKLDVFIKRLSDINKELGNFLATKYAKAKTAETVSATIDGLLQAINQVGENQRQRQLAEEKGRVLQQELTLAQQRIASVQNRAELTELTKVEDRINELRDNVKHNLRYLQKPFYKLQSLAQDGEIALPVDEARKLGEYLNDPFEALATEEDGQPLLKNMLRKIDSAIAQNKLKLKSSRLRKAQEQVDSVLNKASLENLHKDCKQTRLNRNHLLTSGVAASLQNELVKLQEECKRLQKECESTTLRIKTLESEQKKLTEKIENERKELEKTILQLTGKNVGVVLPQPNV